jgi:hypothetical protein
MIPALIMDWRGKLRNINTALSALSPLNGVTAHVLRHSFASVANDLGYTEITIATLIGPSRGTMTSKYVHALDAHWSPLPTPSLVTFKVCWTGWSSNAQALQMIGPHAGQR